MASAKMCTVSLYGSMLFVVCNRLTPSVIRGDTVGIWRNLSGRGVPLLVGANPTSASVFCPSLMIYRGLCPSWKLGIGCPARVISEGEKALSPLHSSFQMEEVMETLDRFAILANQ